MIDIKKLKELLNLMVEHDLAELDLRDKDQAVSLRRAAPGAPVQLHQAPASPPNASSLPAPEAPAAPPDDGLVAIESPMVGTFYTAQNPESPPFVSVGSTVGPETVVCLVEAMKVFNDVKASVAGVVERILVESGAAVEFGQPLFLVRPA